MDILVSAIEKARQNSHVAGNDVHVDLGNIEGIVYTFVYVKERRIEGIGIIKMFAASGRTDHFKVLGICSDE